MRVVLRSLLLLLLLLAGLLYAAVMGLFGRDEGPGRPSTVAVPQEAVQRMARQQQAAAPDGHDTQILFGDLHVHTTVSGDAFLMSLPLLGGEGSRPQADACDFARYCSSLDFWSINDHAEQLTPRRWRETVQAIRQCNAVNADPDNPDTVAFLGWEWSQMGDRPDNHFGHRNVILAGLADDQIPSRPIGASMPEGMPAEFAALSPLRRAVNMLLSPDTRALDAGRYFEQTARARATPCPAGVPVRDMPGNCMEQAATPRELFDKLDDWDLPALVIPHGTTWGNYTPPGADWRKQLGEEGHDPKWQTLLEVYSGHGSAEVYRPWRAQARRSDGSWECPPPGPDYLPSCWRAGQIILEGCMASGVERRECQHRARQARGAYLARGIAGHLVVPGSGVEEWLDAGQCRDCFLPAFNYRPLGSAQYMLALGSFAGPGPATRLRFGFIGSSDNHSARPGTGFKEQNRREMTEATGLRRGWFNRARTPSRPDRHDEVDITLLDVMERAERDRINSFFSTGGLVAVHTLGRGREDIWSALERRQVYGTSGDRILLWFDLVRGQQWLPMGSEVAMTTAPHFEVKAVGAHRQNPGCPEYSRLGLAQERLSALCLDDCYNPSDQRRTIERLEVIKIRPQSHEGESLQALIEDPWLVHECAPDPLGCQFRFHDPDFASDGRDALYYVRAIQEPSLAVNGGNLRCERDARGECIEVRPCHGNEALTDYQDDCLAPVNERAWSSPIFVDYDRGR